MKGRPKLGRLLVRAGLIEEEQLEAALSEQREWGRPLGMTLVRMGLLDEELLIRTLARQLRMPVAWLRGRRVRPEVLGLISRDLAEKYRCLPVAIEGEGEQRVLLLAMEDPADVGRVHEISFVSDLEIRPVLAAPSELDAAIRDHYPDEEPESDPLHLSGEGAGLSEPEILRLGPIGGQGSAAPLAPSGPSQTRGDPNATEVVVRALTQLLVEKGVITREELVERLGALSAPANGEDSD